MSDVEPQTRPSLSELRKAVVNEPRNAQLRHLLGAEMAQQKDYEGAVMEMSAAIALNPLMHVARFQLGLLHLTMSRPDHATAVLGPLESLDDASALKYFKRGLEALMLDDFHTCIEQLRKGVELNSESDPLNRDMQMLADRIVEMAESQPIEPSHSLAAEFAPEPQSQLSQQTDGDAIHTDFGLYDKQSSH